MARSALVIDDSKSARFALRRYLESMSYVVDTAENAEMAFTYLKDHHPEVIFLDHVMPGVDGFDVLNSIKSDPKTIDIPVVICSSNEGEAFTQEARFKGAAEVMTKPPTPQQLARVLSSLERIATTQRGTGAAAPRPVAAAPGTSSAPAPATASPPRPASPTPAPGAKPRDDAMLERVAVLVEQMRAQLGKATQDLTDQIAELKAQIARLESPRGGAFARFRTKVLRTTTKQRLLPRLSGRRKLPRK